MKRKLLAMVLAATMVFGLAACGSDDAGTTKDTPATTDEGTTAEDTTAAADDTTEDEAAVPVEIDVTDGGKVLNIYCWNNEFRSRLAAHYDAYEAIDETSGKIGDVTVNWIETPNANNGYQDALDAALLAQGDAAADDKVDLFLIEADYASKYIETDYTVDVHGLGITDENLANQYQYTKDAVTDSNGVLKGVSWQGCPGVLVYKVDIAEEVLGTSDPEAVQAYVSDWDTFADTAAKMKDAGYKMVSGYDDTYRVFSNNATSPWVVDGVVNIDPSIQAWVDQTKSFTDNDYNNKTTLWGEGWSTGFTGDGNVFCYFGPAWFVDYTMKPTEGCEDGMFKAAEGPQGFFWGGTWICAAAGTDNASEIKDIILTMTTDPEVMKEIVTDDNDFVNNTVAMDEMAASDYKSDFLGGQNPLGMYAAGAANISLGNLTAYDQGCNEEFQAAMKDYFDGNATYDEALATFKEKIVIKYPDLTVE